MTENNYVPLKEAARRLGTGGRAEQEQLIADDTWIKAEAELAELIEDYERHGDSDG